MATAENGSAAAIKSSESGAGQGADSGADPRRARVEAAVLAKEKTVIDAARVAKGLERSPGAGGETDYVGLAFSGGGIRSATFNLGILQSLANRSLLRHIDYLSTVSGGGYIGSWFLAWIKRQAEGERRETLIAQPPQEWASTLAAKAIQKVEGLLRDEHADPHDPDFEAIRNLRRYSNYLTPNVSVFNADTWTLGAIWTRNTLLNMAIIVSLIAIAMVVARLAGLGIAERAAGAPLPWVEPILAGVTMAVVTGIICYNLHGVSKRAMQLDAKAAGKGTAVETASALDTKAIHFGILVTALISSIALSIWMYREPEFFRDDWWSLVTGGMTLVFAIITAGGGFPQWFARNRVAEQKAKRSSKPEKELLETYTALGYLFGFVISLISGFVTAALLYGASLIIASLPFKWAPALVGAFGGPFVLVLLALGVIVQVGLVGRDIPDATREWLGRLRAWSFIYGSAWTLVFAASICGPWVIYSLGKGAGAAAGGSWLATTIGGLWAGNSDRTDGKGGPKGPKAIAIDLLTRVTPYVFILGVFVLVALGIHELVSPPANTLQRHKPGPTATMASTPEPMQVTIGKSEGAYYTHFEARFEDYARDLQRGNYGRWDPTNIDLFNLPMLLAVAILGGGFLSLRVDINEFSMHHFYKNRLVRCFLGASRENRRPDAFTGFDEGDDFSLASLGSGSQEAETKLHGNEQEFAEQIYCGPYPIVNAALNLSGGTALAWQERQAASYVFTPHFSGYDKGLVDRETGVSLPASPDGDGTSGTPGYRPTRYHGYADGIRLGTAVAISGAAANPNSGYHTSTAVAFFLTLLNARLGWWLGNPALGNFARSSPRWGLSYLLVELFGLAHANKEYVNVSDGGHFENLGIYELVRRKCKYIIACDGEQDEGMAFGGLAGAIRKCRADFGVEIDIDLGRLRLNEHLMSNAHCVVGTIHYSDKSKGYLLYLKSSLTGNEDSDVLEYRARDAAFPHQSTGDQWFDESQFESYRRLGRHVAESAFAGLPGIGGESTYAKSKEEFFKRLQMMHHPPSKSILNSFTKHTETLTQLLESLAARDELRDLDESVFSGWSLSGSDAQQSVERRARYWCTGVLQLMENVYVDLGLADANERRHPDNSGWMRLFGRWAVTPVFRRTWDVVGPTYGQRFQLFFRDLQKLEIERVCGDWKPASPPAPFAGLTIVTIHLAAHANQGACELRVEMSGQSLPVNYNGGRAVFELQGVELRLDFEDEPKPATATLSAKGHTHTLKLFRDTRP